MKTKVAVVEDVERTRKLFVEWLAGSPGIEVVGSFGDAASAVAGMPALLPDVALVDINLPPGETGIECVRKLKPLLPCTQFVMLTVYEDVNAIFQALSAGATGYLLKETRRESLLDAISEVSRGGSPMSSSIARKVVQSFTPPEPKEAPERVDATLSPRERELLELLVQGYLYKEIADRLTLSRGSVNTYVRRIYEKLHVHTRAEAMLKYWRSGEKEP